jgi:hypothetical protein
MYAVARSPKAQQTAAPKENPAVAPTAEEATLEPTELRTLGIGVRVQRQAAATEGGPFGAIVEDDVEPGPGQVRRSEFLRTTGAAIEAAATSELAPTGRTAADCPYLTYYLRYYRDKPAAHIERMIERFAKPAATDSDSLQAAIVDRVRVAVRTWAATGRIDVPEGLPEGPPSAAPAIQGFGGPVAGNPHDIRRRIGAGDQLESSVRFRMEDAFGNDFSSVRIHRDEAAGRTATSLSAQAFTVGNDIAFAPGRYAPGTLRGDLLLAHELAHTLQQSGGPDGSRRSDVPGTASKAEQGRSVESDPAELAASRMAVAALTREGAVRGDAAPGAGISAASGSTVERPSARWSSGLALHRCVDEPTSQVAFEGVVAGSLLRVVVVQETKVFLQGMKKSFAVAFNPDPAVRGVAQAPGDQLIVTGRGFPNLTHVRFNVPMGEQRGTPRTTLHPATRTWPLQLMSPGRHDITAFVAVEPGKVVELTTSIDVGKADFEGESRKRATEDMKSTAADTVEQEMMKTILQRAQLRAKAVEAGLLSPVVSQAWTALSIAVVTRAGALQENRGVEGTGTGIEAAITSFQRSVATPPVRLVTALSVLRTRAFASSVERLRSAFMLVADAFDDWVLTQLEGKAGAKEFVAGLKYSTAAEGQLRRIQGDAVQPPVRIPAVFHPEAAYVRKELLVAPPISLGEILSIPLNLWVMNVGGNEWRLRDISNPDHLFQYKTTKPTRDEAIDDLVRKLAEDEEHWPNGRLYVLLPGRGVRPFVTDSDMDPKDWILMAVLIVTAAGILMASAGTAAPAVVSIGSYLLSASAVVGAGMAVADTVDAYERGQLTGKRLALNALQFVASVATAGTSVIAASAARAGALAALGTNARYILLTRVSASSDVLQLAVMSVDTVQQLVTLNTSGGKGEDAGVRAALAVGQLFAQGTLTIISARSAFDGDLNVHPPIELHQPTPGTLLIRNVGAATTDVAGSAGPRVLEDLLAPGGRGFGAGHAPLRDAYGRYRAKTRRSGVEPLEPLDWAKFQSNGRAASYLDATLPSGWRAARRAQYPGSRPHLIERPSASPPEGSIDPTTEQPWRYRRVALEDIRPEVDVDGDPWWTFPDLASNEVLILPSGTRVWRRPGSNTIVEEHPLSESVSSARSRTAGEATIPSAADMGPAHQAAGTERAHGAASPGLGFDSPYSIAHAPKAVNQTLERSGIELYLRSLRDNAPEGVTYLSTTLTTKSGLNLSERVYRIAAIKDGQMHPMFEFKIVVEGGLGNQSARFVADETSVFTGAEAFGAPSIKGRPADAPPKSVDVPRVLRRAVGSVVDAPAPGVTSAVDPIRERSQQMRQRLDDLIEARIRINQLDQAWMDAQDRLNNELRRAEGKLGTPSVDAATRAKLDELLKSMARRSGRSPQVVTPEFLDEHRRAIRALFP